MTKFVFVGEDHFLLSRRVVRVKAKTYEEARKYASKYFRTGTTFSDVDVEEHERLNPHLTKYEIVPEGDSK
jgi:hypothetical protein